MLANANHEQPVTNHKQPTAKDALELFGRNSIGKALFFAYLSELQDNFSLPKRKFFKLQ